MVLKKYCFNNYGTYGHEVVFISTNLINFLMVLKKIPSTIEIKIIRNLHMTKLH
jgi:uncharacterized protein YwgA